MHKKQYLIDGEPASALDIIKMASDYDCHFGDDGLKQTSVAAGILRRNGHTIKERPQGSIVETGNNTQQTLPAAPETGLAQGHIGNVG
jgi:hypothetical protein